MSLLDDQDQTRLAMAALFAALVKALEKRDLISRKEVEAEVGKIYQHVRDNPTQAKGALETLRWTSELLKMP